MSVHLLLKKSLTGRFAVFRAAALQATISFGVTLFAQQVTYAPYLQLGDNGPLGATEQVVVAWQTDETVPNATAYKVDFGTTTNCRKSIRTPIQSA